MSDAKSLPLVNDSALLSAVLRAERAYRNEVAERGGDVVAERLVSKWLAGVEYREWFTLVADRESLLQEVERLTKAVYALQGPM